METIRLNSFLQNIQFSQAFVSNKYLLKFYMTQLIIFRDVDVDLMVTVVQFDAFPYP